MFSYSKDDVLPSSAEEIASQIFASNPTLKREETHASFINLIKFLGPFFWRKPETIVEYDANEVEPLNNRINQSPSKVHFTELFHNMGELLKIETRSAGYVVYIKDNTEIFVCPKGEKYFYRERQEWPLDGTTIACEVIRAKRYLNVTTSRCNLKYPNFQAIPELLASNVLTVPILDNTDECYGAVEVFRENGTNYSMDNVKKMKFMAQWVAEAMKQNKRTVIIQCCNEINSKLFDTLHKTINEVFNKDLDPFLFKVVNLARSTFDAESANLFIYRNNELYKECSTDFSLKNDINRKKLRLTKELQIAYLAFNSTNLINLKDVFNDPKYDREIDKNTGKIIRTVLEIPIYGASADNIHGVLQIFNKIREDAFNKIDEYMIRAFSRYCSVWIQYKRKRLALFKQKYYNLSYKNLTYDITVTERKFSDYFDRNEPIHPHPDFRSFSYYPQPTPAELARLAYYIFSSKCSKYISSKNSLYLFVYAVRKCYKAAPFTNFLSAFIHLHTTYCILLYYPTYFNQLEIFSLLLTTFCMNMDSIGKNIEFLNLVDDPILKIYDKDPIESHQFTLISLILSATNLLQCTNEEKTKLLNLIEENLLGKNLKMHIRYRFQLKQIFAKNDQILETKEHSLLIRTLIVAVSNFSTHAKPLQIANKFADSLVTEYVKLEYMLREVTEVEDKNFTDLDLQENFHKVHCNFMEYVGLHSFELIRNLFPNTQVLYERYLELIIYRKKTVARYRRVLKNSINQTDTVYTEKK